MIQCDLWFPAPKIPVGFGQEAMLPVLVMVAPADCRAKAFEAITLNDHLTALIEIPH